MAAHSSSPFRQTDGQKHASSRKTKQHDAKPFVRLQDATTSPFGIVFLKGFLSNGSSLRPVFPSTSSLGIPPASFLTHKKDFFFFFPKKETIFMFSLIHSCVKYYVGLPELVCCFFTVTKQVV